jgi:hypothetical protein
LPELAQQYGISVSVAFRPVFEPGVLQVLHDMPVGKGDFRGDRVAERLRATGVAPEVEEELIQRLPGLRNVDGARRRPAETRFLRRCRLQRQQECQQQGKRCDNQRDRPPP